MSVEYCGKTWIYTGSSKGVRLPHSNHTCGLLKDHKPEDDGSIIHQCMSCQCWINDLFIPKEA